MGFVYILKSLRNGRYYIGSTINIEKRLLEHNLGKTKSIKYLRPLVLVFSQNFETIKKARKIELKLKKLKSKVIIERIIEEQKINLGP